MPMRRVYWTAAHIGPVLVWCGPPSVTLARDWVAIGSASRVCLVGPYLPYVSYLPGMNLSAHIHTNQAELSWPPGSMLVHRLRQWTSTEPARCTGIWDSLAIAKEHEDSNLHAKKETQTPFNPCSAVELKLAQRPNKFRPTSRTQPREHDESKQCCFNASTCFSLLIPCKNKNIKQKYQLKNWKFYFS